MSTMEEEVNEKSSLLKSGPSSNSTNGRSTDLRRELYPDTEGRGWREEVPQLSNTNEVVCRVCENVIQIGHIKLQYVAKCSRCKEATPIFSAPPGKKYVRCCCCCLLICRSTSERVYCPRPNCNRIILFSPRDPQINPVNSDRTYQSLLCPYCSSNYYFNILSNSVARCPHCHQHSSVDARFKNIRGIGFALAALLLLIIICIIVIAITFASNHSYIYTICVGLLVLFILAVYRSLYYFRLKVSVRVHE